MIGALVLPFIDNVPRSRTVYFDSPVAARTALALLDAGLLSPEAQGSKSGDLVKRGLKAWTSRVPARFGVTLSYREEDGQVEFALEPYAPRPAYDYIAQSDRDCRSRIGPRLERAEGFITGLGQSVLIALAEASERGLPILLPQTMLAMAKVLYWNGRDRETQRQANGAAIPRARPRFGRIFQRRGTLVTRRHFDNAIPTWATEPKRRLTDEGLAALAKRSRTQLTGNVARGLVALRSALAANPKPISLPGSARADRPPLAYVGRLVHEDYGFESMERRVLDDYDHKFQRATPPGESRMGYLARERIAIDARYHERVVAFFRRLEPPIALLAAADQMVKVLVDGTSFEENRHAE